jgi:hypothetical protein
VRQTSNFKQINVFVERQVTASMKNTVLAVDFVLYAIKMSQIASVVMKQIAYLVK